jgi:hypothetical protein
MHENAVRSDPYVTLLGYKSNNAVMTNDTDLTPVECRVRHQRYGDRFSSVATLGDNQGQVVAGIGDTWTGNPGEGRPDVSGDPSPEALQAAF